jgi:hypothetical protein
MPHVYVYKKGIRPGTHHRQPRNNGGIFEFPNSGSDGENEANTYYNVGFDEWKKDNGDDFKMIFWDVTDDENGHIYPAGPLQVLVGNNPLRITAFYIQVSGPGCLSEAILIDAFSATQGKFIDDTFVTVKSNPGMTDTANRDGIVSTTKEVILQAAQTVQSTTEPFKNWMTFNINPAVGDTLTVPAHSAGVAIAIYENNSLPSVRPPTIQGEGIVATIIGGVAVDGPGWVIINGIPHHIDPYGPEFGRLSRGLSIYSQAKILDKKTGREIQKLADKEILGAIKDLESAVLKRQK